MEHKGTLTLHTRRLTLRPFTPEDIDASYRNWEGDEKVTVFLRWTTARTAQEAAGFILRCVDSYSDSAFYQWAIVPNDLAEPIGTISCVSMDERTATIHIGYCIGSRWWRMGYTSESFSRVISFFFEEVRALRIESQHDPMNIASGRVMQKCGLTYEGTLRQADWNNRGIVDACMYAILAEDYFRKI